MITTTVMISVNDGQKLSVLRLSRLRSMKSWYTGLLRKTEAVTQ